MADKTKNANTKGEEKTQRKSLVELAVKNPLHANAAKKDSNSKESTPDVNKYDFSLPLLLPLSC